MWLVSLPTIQNKYVLYNNIYFHYVRNRFPKFWSDVEKELGVYAEDLAAVKSILTALGFATKSSIKSIKNAKGISELENDYMKLLASASSAEILSRFPELKLISSFTLGLKSTLSDIVSELTQKSKPSKFEDVQITKIKLLEQAKKVCLL